MSLLRLYTRVLELLGKEARLGWILAGANLLAGLARNSPSRCCSARSSTCSPASRHTGPLASQLGLAAAGGLGRRSACSPSLCSALVALHADRLAHRQRQAVLTDYFEHIMQLPLTFHTGTHSGRLMKVMLNGTDALWRLWLGFFREHFAAILSLVVLLPLAFYINWRLAILLFALCVVFTVLTTLVVRKTYGMQSEVEAHYSDLSARASDALGNVALVQSFVRIDCRSAGPALRRRQAARRADAGTVVVGAGHRHHPRLHHHHRAGDLHGRHLRCISKDETTVGEIVMFVSFATMLIQKLEQVVSFINSVFMEAPRLKEFFDVLDAVPAVRDRPDAIDTGRLSGLVEFNDVSFSYDGKRPAVEDVSLHRAARPDHRAGRPDRRRQIHRDRAAAPRLRSAIRHHQDRRHGYPRPEADRAAAEHRRGVPGGAAVQPLARRQSARRQAGRHRRGNAHRAQRARRRWNSSSAATRNSKPMPASAAACCPAASGSACRSPARC